MSSHSYALPFWTEPPGAASSPPGTPPGNSPYLRLATEIAGKVAEFLATPFMTGYRIALMRQSISQLGYCDDRLLRDIAGNRCRIACIELVASATRNRDPRCNDG